MQDPQLILTPTIYEELRGLIDSSLKEKDRDFFVLCQRQRLHDRNVFRTVSIVPQHKPTGWYPKSWLGAQPLGLRPEAALECEFHGLHLLHVHVKSESSELLVTERDIERQAQYAEFIWAGSRSYLFGGVFDTQLKAQGNTIRMWAGDLYHRLHLVGVKWPISEEHSPPFRWKNQAAFHGWRIWQIPSLQVLNRTE